MARSRKKTPKLAWSSAVSEKSDKVIAHRKERHDAKVTLKVRLDSDAIRAEHRRSGTWSFGKDGKRWVQNPNAKRMRK